MNEMELAFSAEELDNLIFEALRREQGGNFSTTLRCIAAIIIERKLWKGNVNDPERIPYLIQEKLNKIAIRQKIWFYVRCGFFYPSRFFNEQGDWMELMPTKEGTEYFKEHKPSPYHGESYVGNIKAKIPGFDKNSEFYLNNALNCFHYRLFMPAIFFLGVVAENELLLLYSVYRQFVKIKGKTPPQESARPIQKLKFIIDTFESLKNEIDKDLFSKFQLYVPSLFTFIKSMRDDTGHPTGLDFSESEANAQFSTFPLFLQYVNDVKKQIESRPNINP